MESNTYSNFLWLETGIYVKVSVKAEKHEIHVDAPRNLRDTERSDLIKKVGLPMYGWQYFEHGEEKGTIIVRVE